MRAMRLAFSLNLMWMAYAFLFAQSDYTLDWAASNAAGGNAMTGGLYALQGTAAQPMVGFATSSGYSLISGFWAVAHMIPTCNPYPTAFVSGDAEICAGQQATIAAQLFGTPPWQVTWNDGVVQADVMVSPTSRTVAPATTTSYFITHVADTQCEGLSQGVAVVSVLPFVVETDPAGPCVVQGLEDVVFQGQTPCASGNTTLQWSIPDTGLTYPINQATITVDPVPPGVTVFQFEVHDLDQGLMQSRQLTLLAPVASPYMDYNNDGCNDVEDLHILAPSWQLSYPGFDDPNGDGFLDVRDFLFIRIDPLGTPCP